MRLVTRIIAGLGDTEERAAGRTAEQRIYGFAHKMLKIESWIWTSIANSRVFWTQTTDMGESMTKAHPAHSIRVISTHVLRVPRIRITDAGKSR